MGITYGRHQPPYEPVSIAHLESAQQIQFDSPDDLLKALTQNPELKEQILAGEWVWTTQPIEGGN